MQGLISVALFFDSGQNNTTCPVIECWGSRNIKNALISESFDMTWRKRSCHLKTEDSKSVIKCSADDTLKGSTVANISMERGSDKVVTSFQKADCRKWVRKANQSLNKSFYFLIYPSYSYPISLLPHVTLYTNNFTSNSSWRRERLIASKPFCSRLILKQTPANLCIHIVVGWS